ncbi:MAG: L-seryl-tRNA(Sec) selenium transferase [Syntrophomonadaceae bacterium]
MSLKNIPPVDEILLQPAVIALKETYNHDFITRKIRVAVDQVRMEIRSREENLSRDIIMGKILCRLPGLINETAGGTLIRVINGTGVVLHTNLGRAPLGQQALRFINELACGYNNLEMNLEKGERGSRYHHVEQILTELTGAEAALVVNNNAAAVLLGLNTLANNREVIVSRGQLVEIGGAFRIPEVMRQSGARLVEVGTTNKTYITDFAEAINAETGLLFSAHTSNYKIVGFTEEVPLKELVDLGKKRQLPVMQDLGSGILLNLKQWGLSDEPTVKECVAAGADVVTFSGDKLLGGPQAGIIVGKKGFIEAMKKNQLTRALRVDKLTIAALEGTLLEYMQGYPQNQVPVINMLTLANEELLERAERFQELLAENTRDSALINNITVVPLEDMVGGGAYPTDKIPGWGIEIEFKEHLLEEITRKLRLSRPALIARKQEDKMLISVRTLLPGDMQTIAGLLKQVLER